jgi:hypothetical protein
VHHRGTSARQADDRAGELDLLFGDFWVVLEILDQLEPVRERALYPRASAAFRGDQPGIAVDMLDQRFERGEEPAVAKVSEAYYLPG